MTGYEIRLTERTKMLEIMDSLSQYISLYNQNKELLTSKSAPVMNAFRGGALTWLKTTGIPAKGTENYETIDLRQILAPDYGINLARVRLNVNAGASFRCGVPHLTSSLFFFKNDLYSEAKDARKNFPEGLYVNSISSFCKEYPKTAARYYGSIADLRNPLVALNSLLVQDGIVIWAKEGLKAEFPIQIVSIFENQQPLMALRRILIIAEKDSKLQILDCDHTQTEDVAFLNLQVVEVIAGENASVEICEIEESSEQTTRLSSMYVSQGKQSQVSATGVTLYNGISRNEYNCSFSGPDAHLSLSGMAIEDRTRSVDTFSHVEHTLPGCKTDELFKYVVDDEATGTFSGMIKVNKGADRTEAYQNSRNIIGNDQARIYSKPRLEIYDDDVKCSHGCAIGQLDEKQIFYMRTRGLDEAQAKFLLKQAFMTDVIDKISLPDFKLRLHALVERRFAGESLNCTSCKSNCFSND